METKTLVDRNKYFIESRKVLQMILENEERLGKQMKLEDKLQLVKEHRKSTTVREEYEELTKLEQELENKIRFNQFNEPAIPEEHHEKVKRNVYVEQLELDEKANELKLQLKERIEYLESEVLPLLSSIEQLEKMMGIPYQIEAMLGTEIGEKAPYPARYILNTLAPSNDEIQSNKAINSLNSTIDALKKVQTPVDTKELFEFLKGGAK